MKGKIEILVPDSQTVTIRGELDELDGAGTLMIFESLRDALELDEIDRKLIGLVIYAGGIDALGGPKAKTVRVASEMMRLIDKIKRNRPGFDPLD